MGGVAKPNDTRDHPRVGGEKPSQKGCGNCPAGSPPRGRGKEGARARIVGVPGITPAWAGKSTQSDQPFPEHRDHPRVGGEKPASLARCTTGAGSPPRGRGKASRFRWRICSSGITPAWAGKSEHFERSRPAGRDHPRVGGEKLQWPVAFGLSKGSPPRGRGKGSLWLFSFLLLRITPAWAGKRAACIHRPCADQDHPRVGGEKLLRGRPAAVLRGSPPRGRGKVMFRRSIEMLKRITPAWAGKSAKRPRREKHGWDHPRVGGEKLAALRSAASFLGSPPRGRGKAKCPGSRGNDIGITPAWAGKSQLGGKQSGCCKDHPRVGGEKELQSPELRLPEGSPPRGRGKGKVVQCVQNSGRITPAWAGKSDRFFYRTVPGQDHPRVGGEKRNLAGRNPCNLGSPPRGRGKAAP